MEVVSLRSLTILVLSFVLATGIIGNVMVCLIVCRSQPLKNYKNALHVSLAVVNCLCCCINAPVLLAQLIDEDVLDELLCRIQIVLYLCVSAINLVTVTVICVIRTEVFLYPQTTIGRKTMYILILSTWISGAIACTVSIMAFDNTFYKMCSELRRECASDGKKIRMNLWILLHIVSFCLILICYFIVFCRQRKGRSSWKSCVPNDVNSITSSGIHAADHMELYSNMTSIHTTLILGSILYLSYLPMTVLDFITLQDNKKKKEWLQFSLAFSMLTSTLNPYIYTLRCAAFQKESKQMIQTVFHCIKSK